MRSRSVAKIFCLERRWRSGGESIPGTARPAVVRERTIGTRSSSWLYNHAVDTRASAATVARLSFEIVTACPAPTAASTPNILGYFDAFPVKASYIRCMLPLYLLGERIAIKRKSLGLTKPTLAKKARVGLSTLDALENGRMGELGYSKTTNILAALGLELKLQKASARRPTLEKLMEEARDDQGLDQRR